MWPHYPHGSSWWVTFLIEGLSTGTDLVIPRNANIIGAGNLDLLPGFSSNPSAELLNHRLVITGFSWSYRADAGGDGFRLYWDDKRNSPAVERTIYRSVAQAAGTIEGSCTPTWVPGPGGDFTFTDLVSPIDLPSYVGNPATLEAEVVGSPAATGGSLLVWGVHVSAEAKEFAARSYTGSPVDFNSSPASL